MSEKRIDIGKKCLKCGTKGYFPYYCDKCRKEMAGTKLRKSKDLCSNCVQDWFNYNRANRKIEKGEQCPSYKGAKVVIKDVYCSRQTVIPKIGWRLNCFNFQRG